MKPIDMPQDALMDAKTKAVRIQGEIFALKIELATCASQCGDEWGNSMLTLIAGKEKAYAEAVMLAMHYENEIKRHKEKRLG